MVRQGDSGEKNEAVISDYLETAQMLPAVTDCIKLENLKFFRIY